MARGVVGEVRGDDDRQPEVAAGEGEGQVAGEVAGIDEDEDRVRAGRLEVPPERLVAGRPVDERARPGQVDEDRLVAVDLDPAQLGEDRRPGGVGGLGEAAAAPGEEGRLANVRPSDQGDHRQVGRAVHDPRSVAMDHPAASTAASAGGSIETATVEATERATRDPGPADAHDERPAERGAGGDRDGRPRQEALEGQVGVMVAGDRDDPRGATDRQRIEGQSATGRGRPGDGFDRRRRDVRAAHRALALRRGASSTASAAARPWAMQSGNPTPR